MGAGTGAHVEDMVGATDGVLVMLDDDHGIAQIAQPPQGRQQPIIVALMQHIEHAGQAGADLRRQSDALAFAARQRARFA